MRKGNFVHAETCKESFFYLVLFGRTLPVGLGANALGQSKLPERATVDSRRTPWLASGYCIE